jgi:predicted DNA-binding protein (MmcQ/YjbR family)
MKGFSPRGTSGAWFAGDVTHPIMYDDSDPLLIRLREHALAIPDAAEKISHGHPVFYTTKVFAYYGGSQKIGDERIRREHALLVLLDDGEREALLHDERCFIPSYTGPAGWIGITLDEETDWDEIHELLDASYRRTAGPRRVARLDQALKG